MSYQLLVLYNRSGELCQSVNDGGHRFIISYITYIIINTNQNIYEMTVVFSNKSRWINKNVESNPTSRKIRIYNS